tara:strand:- start:69 stop:500 length:432 start_codon:yes stop_codon:yes gene_type:complete
MKRIAILLLIFSVPMFSMAQKRSIKKSNEKINVSPGSSQQFMVIKGVEIEVLESNLNEGDEISRDVSVERKLKSMLKPQTKLAVFFDSGRMKNEEIAKLQTKATSFRSMSSAVNEATSYGWKFIDANVVHTEGAIYHYYYMER